MWLSFHTLCDSSFILLLKIQHFCFISIMNYLFPPSQSVVWTLFYCCILLFKCLGVTNCSNNFQEYFIDIEQDLGHPWSSGNGSGYEPPFLWYYQDLTSISEESLEYFYSHGIDLADLFLGREGVWITLNGTMYDPETTEDPQGTKTDPEPLFPSISLTLDPVDEYIVEVEMSFYGSPGAALVLEVDGREIQIGDERSPAKVTTAAMEWTTVVEDVFGKTVVIRLKTWTKDDFILLDNIRILSKVQEFTPTTIQTTRRTTTSTEKMTTFREGSTTGHPPCAGSSSESTPTSSQIYFATGDETTSTSTKYTTDPSRTTWDGTMTTEIESSTTDRDYYYAKYSLNTATDLEYPWSSSILNDSDPNSSWFSYYEDVTSIPENGWDYLFQNGIDLCDFLRVEGLWTTMIMTGDKSSESQETFSPFIEISLESLKRHIIQVGASFYAGSGARLVLEVDGHETEIWEGATTWITKVVNVSFGKVARFNLKTWTDGDFILLDKIGVKTIIDGLPPTTTTVVSTPGEETTETQTPITNSTSEIVTTEETENVTTTEKYEESTTGESSEKPETTTEYNGSNSSLIPLKYSALVFINFLCMTVIYFTQ